MLVKLARDWFDRNGVFHAVRDGLAELPDDYDLGEEPSSEKGRPYYRNLPPGAVIMSKSGTLPSPAVPAKPGFQAKAENEQLLDLIPFAAPVDALIRTDNSHVTEADKAATDKMAKLVAEATKPVNAAQSPAEKVIAQVSQSGGKSATPASVAKGKEPAPTNADSSKQEDAAARSSGASAQTATSPQSTQTPTTAGAKETLAAKAAAARNDDDKE